MFGGDGLDEQMMVLWEKRVFECGRTANMFVLLEVSSGPTGSRNSGGGR